MGFRPQGDDLFAGPGPTLAQLLGVRTEMGCRYLCRVVGKASARDFVRYAWTWA